MRKLIFVLLCFVPLWACPAFGAPRLWWVDDDGPADFDNIQEAIDSSWHGDTIAVKKGTYNQNIVFSGKAVTLTSENPNDPNIVQSTIITAAGGYSVTFDFGEDGNSIITGFTITGRGISCYGTSPTIVKNIIRDCTNYGISGQNNAAPVILDNTIVSNTWSAIYSCHGLIVRNTISGNNVGIASCNGPLSDNVISNNGSGGGIYNCQGEITGNIIADNYSSMKGGGLYACNGSIRNNVIIANWTGLEGGGLFDCRGSIGNNIIAGNVSNTGGGLQSCPGDINNNTIVGNRAYTGGAIYGCIGFVRNNILAFNEATEVGGIYIASKNSYNAFSSNIGGNFGGGAARGPNDIIISPMFATNGHWDDRGTPDQSDDIWVNGDYHLKSEAGRWNPVAELWVKDAVTSPCIDAGDPNSDWKAELWPHGQHINLGAYGGTPQASMSSSPAGNVADVDNDGLVNFNDMVLLTEMWLSDQVLLAEDLNRDRIVNLADFAVLAGNWHPGPPTPNPMTWATPPYATSPYSIAMVAATATSTDWSGAEYYFEDFQKPQSNSGWLSYAPGQPAGWENTGLTSNTEYWYRVKARNKLNLLETAWSSIAPATTPPPDEIPPSPNPMTWATPPYATSPTSIRMIATTASDDRGVEYLFECTSHPAYSSTWQDSPTYEATSLPPGIYTFVTRAQDKSPNHNTTANSNAVTVDLSPPTPDPMEWALGGEPKVIHLPPYGTWDYGATMTAAEATDENGVEYKFVCSDSRYSSGGEGDPGPEWRNSDNVIGDPRTYTVKIGQISYVRGVTFRVIARDRSPSHNTTSPSSPPLKPQ
jgi:parallel beta-helix repeat protein